MQPDLVLKNTNHFTAMQQAHPMKNQPNQNSTALAKTRINQPISSIFACMEASLLSELANQSFSVPMQANPPTNPPHPNISAPVQNSQLLNPNLTSPQEERLHSQTLDYAQRQLFCKEAQGLVSVE